MKDTLDTLGDEQATSRRSFKKQNFEIYGNEFVLRDKKD